MGGAAAHFIIFELRVLCLPGVSIKFGLTHFCAVSLPIIAGTNLLILRATY
jgi:hypothetical protein